MPEGVEVKISSEIIRPLVLDRFVSKISVGESSRYSKQNPEGYNEFIESFKKDNWVTNSVTITDVNTKGKFMYWSFSNDWYMFSTFGMTGQWSPIAGKHICLNIKLVDQKDIDGAFINVYFNDPRHFGTIKFVKGKQVLLDKLNELGWDPLNDGINDKWSNVLFNNKLKTSKPIGQMLMDQSLFAGVGNYIRAEALYLAKMSPWRPSNTITRDQFDNLCQALVDVMNDSYKHQGATILTYTDAYGAEGKYSSCFKVYGQKQDPLGNAIAKEETPDKRTIHWCPAIQK